MEREITPSMSLHFPAPQVRKGRNMEKASRGHPGEASSARGREAAGRVGAVNSQQPYFLFPVCAVRSRHRQCVGIWAAGVGFGLSPLQFVCAQLKAAAGCRSSALPPGTEDGGRGDSSGGCPGVAASENTGCSAQDGSSTPSCEASNQERRI